MDQGEAHGALPVTAEKLATGGFQQKGSHCPQLGTHQGTQLAAMQCLKTITAETVLFKLSDSKGKEKEKKEQHVCKKDTFKEEEQ